MVRIEARLACCTFRFACTTTTTLARAVRVWQSAGLVPPNGNKRAQEKAGDTVDDDGALLGLLLHVTSHNKADAYMHA